MRNNQYTQYLADRALGKEKAELVLKNGKVINVFTNEIQVADVAISNGQIVGVGEYEGVEEIDTSGKFICPGFIDAHLHLESTLVRPAELIDRAKRKGTTTFIVDPHEAANVAGIKGIEYILEQTESVQANVFVMVPSCVPALEFEDNGARISAEDIKQFLNNPRILGLGEVMDSASVLSCEPSMLDKLHVFEHKVIDGHGGFLSEKEIMCYKLAGIETDHECCDFETAMKEARAGIQVLIREGTAAKNLDHIVTGIVKNKVPTDKFAFCTDDKHIVEIERDGHISFNVKRAISIGIEPIEAIKMATINAARTYGLKTLGAVAPGYQADLLVFSDLERLEIERVFFQGEEIKEKSSSKSVPVHPKLLNTINLGAIDIESFAFYSMTTTIPIINLVDEQILTRKTIEEVSLVDGKVRLSEGCNKVVVFERHKATKKKGIGIVRGYSVKNGAIASTFCHDSHNLIVIGDNDNDMLLAVKELQRCGGGYAIVENGVVMQTLELPIMGLMSNEKHEVVSEKLAKMIKRAYQMGVSSSIDPFITLSFLTLPVIPEIRITARGIYDVVEKRFQ